MRRKRKTKIIIIALGIIFAFLSINYYTFFNYQRENDVTIEIRDENNLKCATTGNGNITIMAPIMGQTFGEVSPPFVVDINEPFLNSKLFKFFPNFDTTFNNLCSQTKDFTVFRVWHSKEEI